MLTESKNSNSISGAISAPQLGDLSRESLDSSAPVENTASGDRYSELMARAQTGDRDAYAVLLGEIQPIVRLCVGRKVFQVHQRDDVIQDILLSIHVARDSFDPSRSFLPWMRSIMNHRLIDYYRASRRRNETPTVNENGPTDAVEDDFSLGKTIPSAEATIAFKEELSSLSPAQHRLLNLLTTSALSQEEIAQKLGIEAGNLRVQIHRLSTRIKAALE